MGEEQKGLMGVHIRLSRPVVFLIVAQVFFVIFVIITIVRLSKPNKINYDEGAYNPSVSINNFSTVVPDNYTGAIDGLEATLFALILKNSPGKVLSKSIDAFIREDSMRNVFFEDQNLSFLSAIIDIPDIEQSYWFYSEYSSENGNKYVDYYKSYRIFCLDDTQESIYPDFGCKDDFGFEGKHEIVSTLMSYFNFNYFSPSLPSKKGVREVRIKPTDYNIDDATKESYIQETKNAVESLGIAPDLFTYYVTGPEDIVIRYP